MYRAKSITVFTKDRQGIYAQLKGDEVKVGDKLCTVVRNGNDLKWRNKTKVSQTWTSGQWRRIHKQPKFDTETKHTEVRTIEWMH